jgi:CHAD domain-containing protein
MSNALLRSLKNLTSGIAAHAGNLLRRYHPHDLHQLRVGIRRTRSLLKQAGSSPARFFHDSWGELFAVTGPARDFDVFRASVHELLPAAQAEQLEALLRPRLANSHDAVAGLLGSGRWRRHMAGWRGYLKTLESRSSAIRPGDLGAAERTAAQAARTALEEDTDQAWHRFRIALKNLRYIAEAMRGEPGMDATALDGLVNHCKALQTLLGDWHDASVQLTMLDGPELADALRSRPGPAAAAAAFKERVEGRKSSLLEQARVLLDTQGCPTSGGASAA